MLIPVWGKKYIGFFLDYCMPGFLAEGNFGYLADNADFGITFLTKQNSIPVFQTFQTFGKLEKLCSIDYECIDDLLKGNPSYAVPLTLAYLRGMTREKDLMTDTFFLCMNSDFLLAKGSCRKILELIKENKSAILAPSFRVDKKSSLPFYSQVKNKDNDLISVPPREMVKQALDHPHPTVLMRTVNQQFFSSLHTDQMYWQVDNNTLLARFFLIMQLCIKPEKNIQEISGFFDYSLLQTLCPSGNYAYITDSDDFFMVELQDKKTEWEFLSFAKPKKKWIANRLEHWATELHYHHSEHELIFHSDKLPENMAVQKDEFNQFYKDTLALVKKKPPQHNNHHYWHAALIGYFNTQRNLKQTDFRQSFHVLEEIIHEKNTGSSEIALTANSNGKANLIPGLKPSGIKMQLFSETASFFFSVYQKFWAFFTILYGIPPYVWPWHPQWIEMRYISRKLKKLISYNPDLKILYISDLNTYDAVFNGHSQVKKIIPSDLDSYAKIEKQEKCDFCFIHLVGDNINKTHSYLEMTRSLINTQGILSGCISQEINGWDYYMEMAYTYMELRTKPSDPEIKVCRLGSSLTQKILSLSQKMIVFSVHRPFFQNLFFFFYAPVVFGANLFSLFNSLIHRGARSGFTALWLEQKMK